MSRSSVNSLRCLSHHQIKILFIFLIQRFNDLNEYIETIAIDQVCHVFIPSLSILDAPFFPLIDTILPSRMMDCYQLLVQPHLRSDSYCNSRMQFQQSKSYG